MRSRALMRTTDLMHSCIHRAVTVLPRAAARSLHVCIPASGTPASPPPKVMPLSDFSKSPFSLAGKKALVVGVANDQSIAWGCAKAFRFAGADIAMTYLNEKAAPHVKPLAEALDAPLLEPLDYRAPGQLEALFSRIKETWGKLDIVLHAVAFSPAGDLHGRVLDCSSEGFSVAMDVSVHSFIRTLKLAEPLMSEGSCAMTVSYIGAERVIENYRMMGPVKAALESTARYLAADLGPRGIRVHALSPGPMRTRAASGIGHFDQLLADAEARAPEHRLATPDDVGAYAAFLASPAARSVTGEVPHIDGGFHVV